MTVTEKVWEGVLRITRMGSTEQKIRSTLIKIGTIGGMNKSKERK